MSDADPPQGRRKPGRRTRRSLEPVDESLPAPTARRIGHVHATITINPHDPSPAQRSPSPAAHPHAERRVTEVVDLTNDDEDAHNRHFVNPILRHLFTIPLIMGSFFDQRQTRTPDQRDHSSLMDLYGGGYWSKRREEAKKKEEEANNEKARPAPPKIRLTQRSPAPLNTSNDDTVNPSDMTINHAQPTNSDIDSNNHHHATRSTTASQRAHAASNPTSGGQASSNGEKANVGALSLIDRLQEIARRRNPDSRADTPNWVDIEPVNLDDSTDTTPPAAIHHHHAPNDRATPELPPVQDEDDDIQVVGVSPAPPRSASASSDMNVDQDENGVSEEDKRTAATMEAPTNSIFKDYKCVVCLDSVVDATATFCGHIFCEGCILNAIESNHRCPTCRCKLSAQEIHPLFV